MQMLNPTEKLLFDACVQARRQLQLLAAFELNPKIRMGIASDVEKLTNLCDEIKTRYLTI